MTALIALIRKDLILFFSDRRALLLTVVAPIMLGAFMGYMFGGAGKSGSAKIKIAIVAQDTSTVSQKIAIAVKGDANLAAEELPLKEAQDRVLKGKLTLAVVIPSGFGAEASSAFFGAREKPELAIYYDPSRSAELAMVRGILTQHVMQAVSAETFSRSGSQKMADDSLKQLDASGSDDPGLREFLGSLKKYQQARPAPAAAAGGTAAAPSGAAPAGAAPAGGLSVPFSTIEHEVTSGPKFNGFGHSFAGMSVQFILMMSIDIGTGILLARRMGMWNRLLAAPISLSTVLMARVISGAIIGFCLMCVIFAVAVLAFQVPMANPLGFAGIAACFALMTATFGLLLASFGKTPEATRGIAVFATLIMVMLGGAWIPSFLFPAWVQSVTLFIPTRWAIDGIGDMTWRGLGIEAALNSMGVLLLFALVFGVIAFWQFNREGRARQ